MTLGLCGALMSPDAGSARSTIPDVPAPLLATRETDSGACLERLALFVIRSAAPPRRTVIPAACRSSRVQRVRGGGATRARIVAVPLAAADELTSAAYSR